MSEGLRTSNGNHTDLRLAEGYMIGWRKLAEKDARAQKKVEEASKTLDVDTPPLEEPRKSETQEAIDNAKKH